MTFTERRVDNVLVLAAVGRADSTSAPTLEQRLLGVIAAGERRLVVDLGAVDYISSAALRVLLVAARRMQAAQGSWVLCRLSEAVRQVFVLAGFLPLFTIEPTAESAVARLAAV